MFIRPVISGAIIPFDSGVNMMTYDGASEYNLLATVDIADTRKSTIIMQVNIPDFTGGGAQELARIFRTDLVIQVRAYANDYATTELQGKVTVFIGKQGGGTLCNLLTTTTIVGGSDHVIMSSWDGTSTGVANLWVDGVDDDDTGYTSRAIAGGAVDVGTDRHLIVGSTSAGDYVTGQIGFFGYALVYLTNPTDFSTGGTPITIDETTWTEWGGTQPMFWEYNGTMDAHEGFEGQLTESGTITGPE